MVQRHEGAQAPVTDGLENRAVVRHGRFINLPWCRLDARPLDGEAKAVELHRYDEIELPFVVGPKTVGRTRLGGSSRIFPVGPVITWLIGAVVTTLNLKAGGGDTELEGCGPGKFIHGLRLVNITPRERYAHLR